MNTTNKDEGKGRPKSGTSKRPETDMPGWTVGLRQLYDEVVDEDLPDSFRQLLAKLDHEDR